MKEHCQSFLSNKQIVEVRKSLLLHTTTVFSSHSKMNTIENEHLRK